jgi:hypothetical protein
MEPANRLLAFMRKGLFIDLLLFFTKAVFLLVPGHGYFSFKKEKTAPESRQKHTELANLW